LKKALVRALLERNHDKAASVINPGSRTYGPRAVHGVKIFQRDKKLTADGVVGERTWRALGIKDEVVRKGVPTTGGNDSAEKVANGQAEIAIVLISDIHAKDARVAGPLPDAIQLWTVYAAAIPASSKEPEHARAFVAALTGPAMRERWTKAGWQPAPK